jgi:hypothetical protein
MDTLTTTLAEVLMLALNTVAILLFLRMIAPALPAL